MLWIIKQLSELFLTEKIIQKSSLEIDGALDVILVLNLNNNCNIQFGFIAIKIPLNKVEGKETLGHSNQKTSAVTPGLLAISFNLLMLYAILSPGKGLSEH